MSDLFTLTRDARLSPYATSAAAAWLCAADGSRVIWANAAGAALSAGHDFSAQVVRIAATLPARAAARTERLTLAQGDALACTCSRVALGDTPAILIVADAPVQPVMPLAERAARLFGASAVPLLVFSGMGALLFASPQAADKVGSAATLAALGAGALMAQAIADGRAAGTSAIGPLTIRRMGSGGATVLVATFGEEAAAEPPPTIIDEDILAPADPADMLPAEAAAPLAPPEPATSEPAPPEPAAAAPERRYPLRFVWTMDADERFTLASGDFTEVAGARTGALMGQPWGEIASALALDPEGRVAHAVESRDTWSGITLAWPLDGVGERIGVELSGLPIFDRDRSFRGYRGFGVCREITRDTATMPAPHIEPPRTEAEHDTLAAPAEPRPALTVVPAAKNVVPFRAATLVPDKRTALTPVERTAFREIGETLAAPERGSAAPERGSAAPERREPEETPADTAALPSAFATGLDLDHDAATLTEVRAVLERLPVGILIHHGEQLLYANRAFLEWSGYADIHALAEDGGLERLVIEPGAPLDRANGTGKAFNIETRTGETLACEGRLYTVPWEGESALMLVLVRGVMDGRAQSAELALKQAEAETRELHQVLDTAADGVVVLDRDGRVLTFNRAAEALFGYGYHEVARRPFVELFAPNSEDAARDHLAATIENGAAAPNDGHEVTGRTRAGRPIPLFMTMGRIGALNEKVCAVFRDISPWKRTEDDLVNARRNAENASSAKSEFLAKISHEIRTPLNSIIGFSEAMIEERFGAIGNERYREYLNDIHTSGGHIVSLINDLLDLSKIEAGKLDLVFASVNLNQLVQQCVALMQPQANQSRIIIRSSLSPSLPNVTADARSVRQIALNLLSNAIKFTGAGGQVIVSTGATERGEVALRVRDTGAGMTAKELETAMEPFRQLPTSGRKSPEGTGLGLPLTKALAEANRARFSIESEKDAGTLVEVVFGGGARVAE